MRRCRIERLSCSGDVASEALVSHRSDDSRFPIDSPRPRLALRAGFAVRSGIPGSSPGQALPAQFDSRLLRGFTLIEILVVTVILAVSAVAVTLAIAGAGGERQLARDAERLHALIGYACEQAELSGHQIGISLTRDGYRFSRNEHADWLPERDGELRPRKWSVPGGATLTRAGQSVEIGKEFPDKPQLVCFSSGELTAFRLDLALPDSTSRYRLEGHPDGDVVETSVNDRAR
jgi:general secretion pathway protein H